HSGEAGGCMAVELRVPALTALPSRLPANGSHTELVGQPDRTGSQAASGSPVSSRGGHGSPASSRVLASQGGSAADGGRRLGASCQGRAGQAGGAEMITWPGAEAALICCRRRAGAGGGPGGGWGRGLCEVVVVVAGVPGCKGVLDGLHVHAGRAGHLGRGGGGGGVEQVARVDAGLGSGGGGAGQRAAQVADLNAVRRYLGV